MKIKKRIILFISFLFLFCGIIKAEECHHEMAEKYCTNCGERMILPSPGFIAYNFMFLDILKKYNLNIKQNYYPEEILRERKITKEAVKKFNQFLFETKKYCDEKGFDFKDLVSDGMFYKGKDRFSLSVGIHFTEILY